MDNLILTGIAPHPPIIIPAVGGSEREKAQHTCQAMEDWAKMVKGQTPDTIVLISPHGTVFQDAITINEAQEVAGNLAQFGAERVKLSFSTDLELAAAIKQMAGRHQVPVVGFDQQLAQKHGIKQGLDHGALVPLYFLDQAGVRSQIVVVTMGLLTFEELYAFGLAVQQAARLLDKRVAVIASGDLSHRLTPEAPAGYCPEGQQFDELLVKTLGEMDLEGLQEIDWELAEKAGECGLRPIIMMLGALEGMDVSARVYSYEGPFGVGYLVASFKPTSLNPEREFLPRFLAKRNNRVKERRNKESAPVKLARESLEYFVLHGEPMPEQRLQQPLEGLEGQAGVFVSIKKNGQLRGCIGTTSPTQPSIALEIINNAVSAGSKDPRFWPMEEQELPDLVYSVDVLKPAEPISSINQLDPEKYGVIVRSGRRSGLLLPKLEGVDSAEEQVAIAKQKAGIRPEEDCELQRFEVVRYY